MPKIVGKRKQDLIIINLQNTPLDHLASLRIHAMCDVVIKRLMEKLELPIPEFELVRKIKVSRTNDDQFLM